MLKIMKINTHLIDKLHNTLMLQYSENGSGYPVLELDLKF